LGGSSRASVVTRTSEDLQGIPDSSIDLILTDPPYFDNLSYSELSDFYLAWHQSLGIAEPPYDNSYTPAPIEANLALSNRAEESIDAYLRKHGCTPRIASLPDGVFAWGPTAKRARLALEFSLDGAWVVRLAEAFGGVNYLPARMSRFIENWEVEHYRRKVAR
jgi:hypothetical protein